MMCVDQGWGTPGLQVVYGPQDHFYRPATQDFYILYVHLYAHLLNGSHLFSEIKQTVMLCPSQGQGQ